MFIPCLINNRDDPYVAAAQQFAALLQERPSCMTGPLQPLASIDAETVVRVRGVYERGGGRTMQHVTLEFGGLGFEGLVFFLCLPPLLAICTLTCR